MQQAVMQSYNQPMARIYLRQPTLLILIAFTLGLQLMEPSRAWMILLIAFTGIFVSAYLWAWSLGGSLQLRRETKLGWVQVGGQVEERVTLSNASLFPAAWIQFEDESTLPGFNASRSTSIGAGYFDQWTISAACNQRGLFYLGGAKIRTGDPFGIFDATIHAPNRTSILVLPQIATLPPLFIATSGSHGDGKPRRNAPEQTIHASSVREYAHGDSIKLIHWKTTARTNELFVRLMESAPEGNWRILLDLDKKFMSGQGWDSIEEQSVALAASLADMGLRARKSVGLLCNSKKIAWLPPKKGEGQRWEIMQALALATPGKLDLSAFLEKTHSSLGKNHSLIIITASTKPDWLKTLLPLKKRGVISTVMLMDTSAYENKIPAKNVASALEQHDIVCHIIPRGMIQRPERSSQPKVNWTWHTTPTGEVMPIGN
jgi:uncharacterized protein (DUF58 family)